MPRRHSDHEVKIVNYVQREKSSSPQKVLEISTTNRNKLAEYERILSDYQIIGKSVSVDEVQSFDPYEVISKKAKAAWEANGYNPIIVEDVSLFIRGLNDRPGPHIKDYADDVVMREMIVKDWLKGKDRSAVAKVLIGIFDGQEVFYWEGKLSGVISEELLGGNGFGFDDIFIPDGQKLKKGQEPRTFAQMSDDEKDEYSMRSIAIEKLKENPPKLGYPIYMLDEPYEQELNRVQLASLRDKKAINFAFKLESVEVNNPPNKDLQAPHYLPLQVIENPFYERYLEDPNSKSLGLIATNVDYNKIRLKDNGDPVLFQIGPERRHLALAQRVEHFMKMQDPKLLSKLEKLNKENPKKPPRSQMRHPVIEYALDPGGTGDVINTIALKEIGYKKLSAKKKVSRSAILENGIFNKVGKYYRSTFILGSMPPVTGWRDVLVMGALSHMLIFTTRNSIFAGDPDRQVELINSAKEVIKSLGLSEFAQTDALRNVGAAIGSGSVKSEMRRVEALYKKAGVRAFRLYGINSDPRVIEVVRAIREKYGHEVEIFAGQVSDHEQSKALIGKGAEVDGLFFGHGGGRQCTSAENGMAITSMEELYSVIRDPLFDDVTIIQEGGVGTNVGPMLILGLDAISYNQQMVAGSIESGEVYFQLKDGKIGNPYHGSASPATMLIEYEHGIEGRVSASGRVEKVEGKSGYMHYNEKINSMSFHVDRYNHYVARMLADLGVESLQEMYEFLANREGSLLRLVSTEAAVTASAYLSR